MGDVELRAVAEAARYDGQHWYSEEEFVGRWPECCDCGCPVMFDANTKAEALHIATFDPPTVLALLDRLAAAEAKVAQYEHNISWGTTCENCAHLLDRCYAETVRAETAEAAVAGARALHAPEPMLVLTEDCTHEPGHEETWGETKDGDLCCWKCPPEGQIICGECRDSDGSPVEHPCATYAALDPTGGDS